MNNAKNVLQSNLKSKNAKKKNNVLFRKPLVNPYLLNNSFKSDKFNKATTNVRLKKNNVYKNNIVNTNIVKANIVKNKNNIVKANIVKNKNNIVKSKNNVVKNTKPYIKRSIVISRITLDRDRPSPIKQILFVVFGSLIVFTILLLCKKLYVYFTEPSKRDRGKNYLNMVNKETDFIIKKEVLGVSRSNKDMLPEEKEGANIAIEKRGDISENSYISPNPEVYPNEMDDYAVFDETMIQQKNNMESEKDKDKVNQYIKKQNVYIRDINNRVAQINENRMNTPTYTRDISALHEIRNFERKLANKVNREQASQPYLVDQ